MTSAVSAVTELGQAPKSGFITQDLEITMDHDPLQSTINGGSRKRKRSRKVQPDRKFECTFEGCGKSYSRAEHLYRHQLNRMSIRPVAPVRVTDSALARFSQTPQSKSTGVTSLIVTAPSCDKTSVFVTASDTPPRVRNCRSATSSHMQHRRRQNSRSRRMSRQ